MNNYILKITDEPKKVKKIAKNRSYTLKIRNKKYPNLQSITIYDANEIEKIILQKYYKEYAKLSKLFANADEANSDTDLMICLNETYRLKELLERQYQKYLKKAKYEFFLNELMRMGKILQEKIMQNNLVEEYENEVKMGR